ncbi:MAG TPA: hypothetical protein VG929_09085 [Actinomycetota bacterium]|nr:hypothetical protein [Actinomycetota bacterium]
MHQGAWLLWATAAGLVAISTTNPFYLLALVGVALLVHAACARPGPALRSLKVFVAFGLITIVTRTGLTFLSPPVSASSVVTGLLEGLRLATLLTVFGTFNAVSDPSAILKLAPRRFHEASLAAALALSIAPRTVVAAGEVREAQRMRGIHVSRLRMLPALAVPVLETGMEQAMALAESMDARGHGRGRRSRYRTQRWDRGSLAVSLGAALALAVFVIAGRIGHGDLSVSTYPLVWPDVSVVLVGILLALCVPVAVDPAPQR